MQTYAEPKEKNHGLTQDGFSSSRDRAAYIPQPAGASASDRVGQLQARMNNRPAAMQLRKFQQMADRGPQARGLAQLQRRMNRGNHASADPVQRLCPACEAEQKSEEKELLQGKFSSAQPQATSAADPSHTNHPGSGIVQMRACSDGVDWSTRDPGHNSAALRLSGMQVTAEEAHILCCAYCKAQVRSLANADEADPAGILGAIRFTNLFDQFVPQEQAAANLPATTTLHLEESYFIGSNNANDSLLNNVWWNAIRIPINANFFTGVGNYLAGTPVAAQAEFDALQGVGPIAAAPPLPVGRRSYNLLAVVLFSAIYKIARLLDSHPAVAVGMLAPAATAWGLLRIAAGGHARSSDVTIDRAPMGAAASSSILDAKFSYGGGGFDFFHGNQEADLLRAHAVLPGAGAGVGGLAPGHIAALTLGTCSCDRDFIESQKRKKRRSLTLKGEDVPSSRTRGGKERIKRQYEEQGEKRKRLKYVK